MRKVIIVSPGHRDNNPRAFDWRVMAGKVDGLKFIPDHPDDFCVTFASYLEAMQARLRAAYPDWKSK